MNPDRQSTSKSRGICRFYNTPRGCRAGNQCKFLHGESEKLTPYDKSKTCHFYAAGFCRRGDKCWFQHVASDASTSQIQTAPAAEEEELCCICYEKPVTYGLLIGCSHMFCIHCIREWRSSNNRSVEVVSSGVTKQCPLCRAASRFVIPSSQYFPEGHPRKAETINRYKASMARVPCRHFQNSPANRRFCPFGKDCFYQHLKYDGTPYIFQHGADHNMRIYRRRLERANGRGPHGLIGDLFPDFPDLGATIDALRASLPGLMEGLGLPMVPMDDADWDIEPEEDFEDRPLVETMEMLVDFLTNVQAEEVGGRTFYRFGTAPTIPIADNGPAFAPRTDVQNPGLQPDQQLNTRGLDALVPSTAATPSTVMERAPANRSVSDSPSRFSTVVTREDQASTSLSISSLDDLRQLPDLAANPPQVPSLFIPDAVGSLVPQARISSTADTVPPEARQPVIPRDSATQASATARPSNSQASQEEAPSEPISAPPAEVVHDTDPPFLTDGRGRVVWSSTTAGRHRGDRESRRAGRAAAAAAASASAPAPVQAQQKMRREASDSDVAIARAESGSGEDSGGRERQGSRPRQSARVLSSPEGTQQISDGSLEVLDGIRSDERRFLLPASDAQAIEGPIASGSTEEPEAPGTDEDEQQLIEEVARRNEGRSFFGRIFGAVLFF